MTQEFVTLPREVVEQALDSLLNEGGFRKILKPLIEKSIESIREALEQPQDHVPDAGNMVLAGWKLVPMEPTIRQMAAMGPAIRACYDMDGVSGNVIDVYRAMLAAAPQPPTAEQSSAVERQQDEQEPVAWMFHAGDIWKFRWHHFNRPMGDDALKYWKPLYTHQQNLRCKSTQKRLATLWGYVKEQPKREPLTDEKIINIADDYKSQWVHGGQTYDQFDSMAFARAIEAAHNIK